MNKKLILFSGIIILLLILGLIIPKTTKPSTNTRIILEHHEQTFIAPKCFEQSDVTNYLEDSTLKYAYERNYDAHDECTANELTPEQDSLLISLLKDIGLLEKKWDNW